MKSGLELLGTFPEPYKDKAVYITFTVVVIAKNARQDEILSWK